MWAIDPVAAHGLDYFNIDATQDGLSSPHGEGVAYDSNRDLLYISFSSSVASQNIVLSFTPTAGPAKLFSTPLPIHGLAYDPVTDTLRSGCDGVVQNLSLSGQVLSSFPIPQNGVSVEGLEFAAGTNTPAQVSTTSAASLQAGGPVALAAGTKTALVAPLPTSLGGVSVKVKDSAATSAWRHCSGCRPRRSITKFLPARRTVRHQ